MPSTRLLLIPRGATERAVPTEDCSGYTYSSDEREDLIRYVLVGAEIQRDRDLDTIKEVTPETQRK